jgi:hypothetical protein
LRNPSTATLSIVTSTGRKKDVKSTVSYYRK